MGNTNPRFAFLASALRRLRSGLRRTGALEPVVSEEHPRTAAVDFVPLERIDDLKEIDYHGQQAFEQSLLQTAAESDTPAYRLSGLCAACGTAREFEFEWDRSEVPNWRESLRCRNCGLISRWRASIELFQRLRANRSSPGERVYLTERLTPSYRWFAAHCDHAVGSEFIAEDCRPGQRKAVHGRLVRHEDVTALSFADGSLSWVLSFDVLEHVADYRQALREFFRVLEPGGRLILSAPFVLNAQATDTLARISADGSIEHLREPEYHQDPVCEQGALCYYHFGWDLLTEMRHIGFGDVRLRLYWDPARGYLGFGQPLISAERPGSGDALAESAG